MDIIASVRTFLQSARSTLLSRDPLHPNNDVFQKPIESIASKARNSISYYPLIVSESVTPDTGAMLGKYVQTLAATYTRLMISIEDIVSADPGGKTELLKRIRGSSLRDAIFDEDCQLVNAYLRGRDGERLTQLGATQVERVLRAPLQEALGKNASVDELTDDEDNLDAAPSPSFGSASSGDVHAGPDIRGMADRAAKAQFDRMAKDSAKTGGDATADEVKAIMSGDKKDKKPSHTGSKATISQRDAELMNRARPLILELEIQYMVPGAEGSAGQLKSANILLGIKTIVHAIPSLDLVAGVGSALAGDSLLFQFLRATSGETSFLSDFILNIQGAKDRVLKKETGGRMLATLRRQAEWNRAARAKIVRDFTKQGQCPPTATVAVTSDEVEKVRNIYGVDLTKPAQVKAFIRSHNLMGFMIVDEGVGLARVWEDGTDDFERVPFTEMREKGKDSSLRDIVSLLNRA